MYGNQKLKFYGQNDIFRTWIYEECPPAGPAGDTLLGYFEWGYTVLLHVDAPGSVTSVNIPPIPPGIPAPPGGWPPNVPTTTPVSWIDADNAPPNIRSDYDTAFP